MIVNNTCVPGNDTTSCVAPSLAAGWIWGLTLFFLLLVIVAGVIVYKYHSKIRNMLQFGQRRTQTKKDFTETAHTDSKQYASMIRDQSVGQTPIYENLTTKTSGYNRHSANQSRSFGQPEEDLYLQCDLPDDAIYNNDPPCNLFIVPDSQEEDVYIVPDS